MGLVCSLRVGIDDCNSVQVQISGSFLVCKNYFTYQKGADWLLYLRIEAIVKDGDIFTGDIR